MFRSRSSRAQRRIRRLTAETLESRIVLVAPVATAFPVGVVPLGTTLRIEAADIVSDFGTDSDSNLQSSSVTFISASVNGGAARPLADVGFAYLAGAGKAGTIVLNTATAPAFSGLAVAATANVSIGFRVSDGTLLANSVLNYSVSSSKRIANIVNVRVVGPTVPGQGLEVNVPPAASANTVLNVSMSGLQDITDGLASLDFRQSVGTAFNTLFTNSLLTIAVAHAGNNGTATSKASDGSKSLAVADSGSTASARTMNRSEGRATASDTIVATSNADNQSKAISIAPQGGSTATANATGGSEATASATLASSADSRASDKSTSIATATSGSAAVAQAGGTASPTSPARFRNTVFSEVVA